MNKTKTIILGLLLAASVAPLFAQTPVAELNFYKKQSQSDDKKLLQTVAENLSSWVAKNPSSQDADDALFLRAEIQARIKNYPAAFVTLLRHKYEFPSSKNAGTVKELTGVVTDGLRRKEKDGAKAAAAVVVTGTKVDDRLAAFLAAATQLEVKNMYQPLLDEYNAFFNRFPQYEGRDKLELMLGDWHRQNKNYQAAIMQYSKVYDIYPSTRYKAASLRMMGDIYAGELKDYAKADYYYQAVLKNYPDSVERGVTLHHLAILQETQRDYKGAVDSLDKALEAYFKENQKEDAYLALRYKADIQKNKLKDYAAAADTLKKTADIYAKDQYKYTDTMTEAAYIYGRKLKDPYGQLNALQSIVIAYPADPKAPQALYDASELAEKLGELEKAKTNYRQLIINYPADSLAVKAQRRLNSIAKKQVEQEEESADAQVKQVIAPAAKQQVKPAENAPAATVAEDDGQEADDTFFEVDDDSSAQ